LSDEQLRKYIEYGARVAGMIPRLGCPSVAAINGAALGGGAEGTFSQQSIDRRQAG